MLDAAKRSGKKLTIGYQNRQRPDSQFLKAEALEAALSAIYTTQRLPRSADAAVPTWGVFLNEYEQGGGPLIDIGTHALDLTLWTMDNYKPEVLRAELHITSSTTIPRAGNAWGDWDPATASPLRTLRSASS